MKIWINYRWRGLTWDSRLTPKGEVIKVDGSRSRPWTYVLPMDLFTHLFYLLRIPFCSWLKITIIERDKGLTVEGDFGKVDLRYQHYLLFKPSTSGNSVSFLNLSCLSRYYFNSEKEFSCVLYYTFVHIGEGRTWFPALLHSGSLVRSSTEFTPKDL